MSESIIKQGRREPFTVLYKSAIRDNRLSFEALGFLTYMLDKPPDWEFTISGMAKERNVGKDAVRRLVGRLEQAGYLLREQSHDEGGKFAKNIYVLQEKPPLSGKTDNGENRQREKPLTVFPTQSKNVETKEYINIPPISPQGGVRARKRKEPRDAPDWNPERFEGFWKFYPRSGRKDKQRAMDAWDKLQPSDELISTIARALVKQKASEEWQRGIGIPYAATYLNNARWEDADELDEPEEDSSGGWAEDEEVL